MYGLSVYPSRVNPAKASILVVALWSLCLLSSFAVILNYQVRQALTLASRLEQRNKLRLAAQAAIFRGIAEVKSDPEKTYFSLGDPWSDNPGAFKDIAVGSVNSSLTHVLLDPKSGASRTVYGCSDEESKININKADLNTMARLFKVVLGLEDASAQELAACIIDWRDADSALSVPAGSAEDFYYGSLSSPYAAKNAPLETIDELLLIKDVNQNVFERIKDYVTIYGEGRVNANTASMAVLYALGLDADLAAKVVATRAGKDGIASTSDDSPFVSTADIVASVSAAFPLSATQVEQLNRVAALNLAVVSQNFSARAEASAGRYTLTVESTFSRQGQILYWREI